MSVLSGLIDLFMANLNAESSQIQGSLLLLTLFQYSDTFGITRDEGRLDFYNPSIIILSDPHKALCVNCLITIILYVVPTCRHFSVINYITDTINF